MQLIRCTQKLLKDLKVTPVDENPQHSFLGCWHANLLRLKRKKCVLFTNDLTAYSFVVFGLQKPEFMYFTEVFGQNLFKNLLYEGFSQSQIERVLNEYREIGIAKTNNRSVLGTMNELAFQLECRSYEYESLENIDLYKLNHELNRTILGASRKFKYGLDLLGERLR